MSIVPAKNFYPADKAVAIAANNNESELQEPAADRWSYEAMPANAANPKGYWVVLIKDETGTEVGYL